MCESTLYDRLACVRRKTGKAARFKEEVSDDEELEDENRILGLAMNRLSSHIVLHGDGTWIVPVTYLVLLMISKRDDLDCAQDYEQKPSTFRK